MWWVRRVREEMEGWWQCNRTGDIQIVLKANNAIYTRFSNTVPSGSIKRERCSVVNCGCKNRLRGSQKTSSDVKHLLSDCFAVDRFYDSRHTSTRLFTIWKVLQLNHLFWHLTSFIIESLILTFDQFYNRITYFDIWPVLYLNHLFWHFKSFIFIHLWTSEIRAKGMFIYKSELTCYICYQSPNKTLLSSYEKLPSSKLHGHPWMIDWKSPCVTTFCLSYAFSI